MISDIALGFQLKIEAQPHSARHAWLPPNILAPNVSVCDRDLTGQQFFCDPCLIVEVISLSTDAYDRGDKFSLYRRLDSQQAYVLVGSKYR